MGAAENPGNAFQPNDECAVRANFADASRRDAPLLAAGPRDRKVARANDADRAAAVAARSESSGTERLGTPRCACGARHRTGGANWFGRRRNGDRLRCKKE